MMKTWRLLTLSFMLFGLLCGCGLGPDAAKNLPFQNLQSTELVSAEITLSPSDAAVTLTDPQDLQALTALLQPVELYEQDDAGRDENGQLVSFSLKKTDGSTVTLGAYGDHILYNDVCYKASAAPCQALSDFALRASQAAAPKPPRFLVTTDAYQETFFADDGTTSLLEAAYALPVVTVLGNSEASEAINAFFLTQKDRFLHAPSEYEAGVDSALADAKLLREEGYTGEAFAMDRSFSISRADEAVLSLCIRDYTYLGGVHPNHVFSGLSFDSQGTLLTLDSLSSDPAAFRAFCIAQVTAMAEASYEGQYYEDYKTLIPGNIRDDMWYFTADGLTFLYNAYDLGSYAAGMFEFTIPYAALSGVIDDRWLPAGDAAGATGTLTCQLDAQADSAEPLFTVTAGEDGAALLFTADGTVADIFLCSAYDNAEGYVETGLVLYLSRLDGGDSFRLDYLFSGDMAGLMLRYTGMAGEPVSRFIQLSGMDGSVLMLETE